MTTTVTNLSMDELSNVLSYLPPKELIKCCLNVNKSFHSAVFHSNAWPHTRLSSRQLFKCKNFLVFQHFVKNAWSNLNKFSFMNYKTALNRQQKEILKVRLLSILNSSHNSLSNLTLHGADISLFDRSYDIDQEDDVKSDDMKPLRNLNMLWIVTTKRERIITEKIWTNFTWSSCLKTLEFMSNYPLKVDDIENLRMAFVNNSNTKLKNLKLSIAIDVDCNKKVMQLIDLLSNSLEIIFITGMKYIDNAQTQICDALCKCKNLNTLSLMYRNRHNTHDLYTHIQCFELLYQLSFSLMHLKVLSLEYGPLIDYEWQEKYKKHINQYFKSLIWVKIGQNRIKNPFLSTVINQHIKVNRFCLSWNANQ